MRAGGGEAGSDREATGEGEGGRYQWSGGQSKARLDKYVIIPAQGRAWASKDELGRLS